MRPDRYSRTVAWLKVALPLAALALLSTLFLLSRDMDPGQAIPFADKEVQDRLRDQQITAPFFSGSTADGDQLSFSAVKITTPEGQIGTNQAENIVARIILADGPEVTILSDLAQFNIAEDLAMLEGNVRLKSSNGYKIQTHALHSEMSSLRITAPENVQADSPFGQINAGGMTLQLAENGSAAQMVFTNGVKLVYTRN